MNKLSMTEDDLQAWVDGALPAVRRGEVEEYLATHPEEAERVRAYRAQKQALQQTGCRRQYVTPVDPHNAVTQGKLRLDIIERSPQRFKPARHCQASAHTIGFDERPDRKLCSSRHR